MEHVQRTVVAGLRRGPGRLQETQQAGVSGRAGRDAVDGSGQPRRARGQRQAVELEGLRTHPRPRQCVEERANQRRPRRIRQFHHHVGSRDRAPGQMRAGLLEHDRHVGDAMRAEMPLVGREHRHQLGVLGGRRKRRRGKVGRLQARVPQLPNRPPQRLGQRRMLGHRPEVAAGLGQVEQQAHDERRSQRLFRRVDSLLDQEGRRHADGDVERGDESQVRPVAALTRETVAQGEADRVGRDEHPLGAGGMRPAQPRQLSDERFTRHLFTTGACARFTGARAGAEAGCRHDGSLPRCGQGWLAGRR